MSDRRLASCSRLTGPDGDLDMKVFNEWQPIETAPKDGRYIIVWPPTWNGVTSCAYFDEDEYRKKPKSYWQRIDADITTSKKLRPPTHWMPVIAGPD